MLFKEKSNEKRGLQMKKVMLIVLSSIFVLSTNIQVAQAFSSGSRGGFSSSSRSSYSSGASSKSSYSSSSSSYKSSSSKPSSSSSSKNSGSSYKSGVKSYKPSTSDTTKKTTTDKQTSGSEDKKDTGKISLTKPDTTTQNKKETSETQKSTTSTQNNTISNQQNTNRTSKLTKNSSDDYKKKHRYTGPVPNKSKFLYTALGAYLIYKFTQPNGQPVYANVENGKEVEMDDVKDYEEVSSIPEDVKVNSDLKKDVNELKTENQQQIAADKANEKALEEEAKKKDRTGLYTIFGLVIAALAGIFVINKRKGKVS